MMLSIEEFSARVREAMPWAEVSVFMDEINITCPPGRQEEAVEIVKRLYQQ